MPVTRTQAVKKTTKTVITRGQRARGMSTPEVDDAENSPLKVILGFFTLGKHTLCVFIPTKNP